MRKQVMTLAWSLIKSAKSAINNLSDALICAWRTIKAKAALQRGRVLLTFTKGDGTQTTREATAYTGVKKTNKPSNPLVLTFHSLTDAGTRCCRVERLIDFKVA